MEHFKYDPITGVIIRLNRQGNYQAGTVCDSKLGKYLKVTLDGVAYLQHRVAWYLHNNEQPPQVIDHIDKDGTNNCIANLRAATTSTNQMNIDVHTRSKTGIKGIMPIRNGTLFRAEVCVDGKRYQKHSKDIEVLTKWLEVTRSKHHGEFTSS